MSYDEASFHYILVVPIKQVSSRIYTLKDTSRLNRLSLLHNNTLKKKSLNKYKKNIYQVG